MAVIVNEFGEIGIDGELIDAGDEELIELSSGCICCVVRGDLIRVLRSLLAGKPGIDGIVIETTGLANPSPVIQTMIADQVIGAQCRLDSVLCMVDAVRILDQLDAATDAAEQIAFSDHLVLNKVGDAAVPVETVEARLRGLNPFAPITRANRSEAPARDILDRRSFDLERIEARLIADENGGSDRHHVDGDGIASVSLTSEAPLNANRLEDWLRDLLARCGSYICRTKGIVSIAGEDRKLALQAVNMMLEGDYIGPWGERARRSHMVFIGRRLDADALKSGFERCREDSTPFVS